MVPCSLPEDKPKLIIYAFMMFIQNFGFHLMYYQIYHEIPSPQNGDCDDLRFWVGFFALDCFVESFVCVWMGMAGYTDDQTLFPIMWVFHLLVALPYCLCTITIPLSIYADKGKDCRAAAGARLYPLEAVFWTHCCLFLVYVWMMLSVTYYSFAKATFFYPDLYPAAGSKVAVKPAEEGSSPVETFNSDA